MAASFIVQIADGTEAGANAYIDVATFQQYHLDRGRDESALSDTAVQTAIVLATDYIDLRWRLRFAGRVLDTAMDGSQTTLWPRKCAFYDDGCTPIVGIPTQLKRACAEYALRATVGPLLVDGPAPIVGGEMQPTGALTSTAVTVGPISERKTFEAFNGGYGTGTILINGILFLTIPAADLQIEVLLDQQSIQRRATR